MRNTIICIESNHKRFMLGLGRVVEQNIVMKSISNDNRQEYSQTYRDSRHLQILFESCGKDAWQYSTVFDVFDSYTWLYSIGRTSFVKRVFALI